jgi:hypothetical protein
MANIINSFIESIRSRSRSEWQVFFNNHWTGVKDYVRLNGERSAILGFALGVFIVLFYKLAILLGCLVILAYQVIMIVADSDRKNKL